MRPADPLACRSRTKRLALQGLDRSDWYDKAQKEIIAVCLFEGWNVKRFTNTLAILSPRVSIRRNVRATLAYIGQGEHLVATMGPYKRSLAVYESTGEVGGHKVPYFARALHGDPTAVTLDTWMSYALLRVDNPSIKYFRRRNTFNAAYRLVESIGKSIGLSPRDCQAAIWNGIFRESGQSPQYFPVLEEYQRWLSYDREFPLSGTITEPDNTIADPEEIMETTGQDDTSFDIASFSAEPVF